jgi:2-hydroxychromene-2-carboxylate isomerase
MARDLRFYIDYKSPYAYLTKDPVYELEREFGVQFTWLPINLFIPDFLGTVEGRNDHQWRRVRYSYMDARRLANRRGLTVRGPQKLFDTALASIGMIYAQRRGTFRKYNDLTFERFWKRELDIEDVSVIAAALNDAGADGDAFPMQAAAAREEVTAISCAAEAAGVFGVPSFVVHGELFWGREHLPDIRAMLAVR